MAVRGCGIAVARGVAALRRRVAPLLDRVLCDTATAPTRDPGAVAAILERGRSALREGGIAVDYLELRDAEDLRSMQRLAGARRLLAAVRLGPTRLIDNVAVADQRAE